MVSAGEDLTSFQRGNGSIKELDSFQPGERVANGSIEYGVPLGGKDGPCILAVRLYTNRGRRLLGQATKNLTIAPGRIIKDDVEYEQVMSVFVDSPLSKGTFKGFFGRSNEPAGPSNGILRLGLIWGDISKSSPGANASGFGSTAQPYDYNAQNAQVDGLKKQVTFAQAGYVQPETWSYNPNFAQVSTRKFQPPYSKVPRVLSGLARVEQERGTPIRVGMNHQNVTPDGFEMSARAFGGGMSYGMGSSWLALPENDIHFETGVIDSTVYGRSADRQSIRNRVPFANKFVGIPRVITWLYELNFDRGWHSMATNALNLAEDSFEINIYTWAGRSFDGVKVGWLAFNDTGCVSRAKTGIISVLRAERYKTGATVTFDGAPFSKPPAVFFALTEFDSGDEKNLRLTGEVVNVSKTGFTYNCGTWANPDDHNMDHSNWLWIAIE